MQNTGRSSAGRGAAARPLSIVVGEMKAAMQGSVRQGECARALPRLAGGPSRLVLAATLLLLAVATMRGQETPQYAWGGAMEEKLYAFVPQPQLGIVERTRWKVPSGLGANYGNGRHVYYTVDVGKRWVFDDPQYDSERDAWERDFNAFLERGKSRTDVGNVTAEAREFDRRQKDIKPRAGSLDLVISVNEPPDNLAASHPVATLRGLPLYRSANFDASDSSTRVDLWVYLGPPGFKNPVGHGTNMLRQYVKCIVVQATTHSPSGAAQAEESKARRMLEHVDYDGLAKLLAESVAADRDSDSILDKLMPFLPTPVPGLVGRMPWDDPRYNHPDAFRLGVGQAWRFADAQLVQQYATAQAGRMPLGPVKMRGRLLIIMIKANHDASIDFRELHGSATPVGTLKGYPLYRHAYSFPNFGGQVIAHDVRLGVLIAPASQDPPASVLPRQLRVILVEAELKSFADTGAADEALTLQMLEKIDYAGLARLIER